MKPHILNKTLLINFVFAICTFVFFIIITEASVRFLGIFQGQSFFSNPYNKFNSTINNVIPFRTFGHKLYSFDHQQKYILDRYGKKYPYIKNSNTFRIVCLGGSTTENLQNYQQSGIHYPMLLEQLLQKEYPNKKIEVINTSFAAYSSIHSIILLAFDVIYWNPDAVIFSHNINDLTASYWPNFTTDYSNKYAHSFYTNPYYSKNFSMTDALLQHFRIYWWMKKLLEQTTALKQEKTIQRKSYGSEPPQEGLKTFENNINTFITIAKQKNILLLLTTEPFEPSLEMFNRHLPNKAYNDIVVYPLQEELIAHHKHYNNQIAKIAAQQNVMFIDLDQEFNANKDLFSDLVHYTDLGVKKLARSLANYIKSKELIK